ncbi:MAG: hypothetical protein AAGA68_06250 [Pseudomonadota bacterium]
MDLQPRIIAGSARSGTTWVVDALSTANGAGTLFEPLNPDAIPQAVPFANERIAQHDEAAHARAFFDELFNGAYRNLWTLGRAYREELRLGPQRSLPKVARKLTAAAGNYWRYGRPSAQAGWLYKVVRASLMLGWLEQHYDARIALVIRHPGAVVASRVRRGWPWRPTLERYLANEHVATLLGAPTREAAARISDEIRGHTAIWCVQHAVALHDWESSRFSVHFYEHLIDAQAEQEWTRLTRQLGLPSLPSARVLSKPSQQADQGAKGAMNAGSPRWRFALRRQDLVCIGDVLERFENELYIPSRDGPTDAAKRYLARR